ncbi:hypothetical protein H6F46_11940 [Limnothrix sp. FACHB-1083]|uniref:hypothetical protein n=1 Tax=unclassified Limnothrix TaxID=2632864 RepID=UPI00168098E4|nr:MULTISPECIES: hypothetical protein [unclassified Limnothrix]MBD2161401.1 hypothetical protein [Limnothrix sp. FACHB-1083]MBD2192087.1 hypothetical protein [Limnothrix sp. FACHB-1088]
MTAQFWNPFDPNDPDTWPADEQEVLCLEDGEISASTVWAAFWQDGDFYSYDGGELASLLEDLDLEVTHWAAIPPLL